MSNLRKLANGQPCRLRLPGVCSYDPAKTVLCHIKRGWCGSLKPPDIVAMQGCSNCHDVIDRRRPNPWSEEELDSMILRALCEQLSYYTKAGIVRW